MESSIIHYTQSSATRRDKRHKSVAPTLENFPVAIPVVSRIRVDRPRLLQSISMELPQILLYYWSHKIA